MSGFSPKQWLIPKTIGEAVGVMREHSGEVLLFGGGTYVHELRENGSLQWVKTVIDLQALGLNYVKDSGTDIRIGAMTTLNDMISFPGFRAGNFQALVQAAYAMGPEQVKNAATLGGAIACKIPIIDIVPALLSLGARAVTESVGETREVELWDLLNGPEASRLGRETMIVEIRLPRPAPASRSHFRKFRRSAADWPVANACISVQLDASRRCSDAKLVLGFRPEGYFRMRKSEQFLLGKSLTQNTLEDLARLIPEEIRVADHFTASAEYKRLLAKALLRENLLKAAES